MALNKPENIYSCFNSPAHVANAKKMQEELRKSIIIAPLKKEPSYIAGVDAAFIHDKIIAVAVLYDYPGISYLTQAYSIEKTLFPYIPGFLSFREGQSVINALKSLQAQPDVILFDGHGIAHPRGVGIASHIGVMLGIPSIGCAKSRLIGEYKEPKAQKGSWSNLLYKGRKVGVVLRTRANVKPVFVSPGHLLDIDSSIKIVLDCTTNFRVPEPLRNADKISKKLKKNFI